MIQSGNKLALTTCPKGGTTIFRLLWEKKTEYKLGKPSLYNFLKEVKKEQKDTETLQRKLALGQTTRDFN